MNLEDFIKGEPIWPRPDYNKEELMQFAREQTQQLIEVRLALIKYLLEKR
jgi:hypothetical protein